MATFALISEGLTDQIILERMIEQICDELFEDGVDINPLQPLRDATDGAEGEFGGWELVLECCEQRAAAALEANDYVVVHIDTDQGEHPLFGLPLTFQGKARSFEDLVAGAIDIITSKLSDDLYRKHADRFLFAISVHSMESWLLLYFFDVDKPKSSLKHLNHLFRKGNQAPLTKVPRAYLEVARQIKRKHLLKLSGGSNSLGLFLTILGKLGNAGKSGS